MADEKTPVALISGGSRGIGRAAAVRLAKDGYAISFCFHSKEEAARELEKEIGELGVQVRSAKVDVTDGASVREWVAETEAEFGGIDVAVTAAGITKDSPLVMMSDDDWHSVLDTNLDGVYHVCRAVVFGMMKRKSGSVITISSVAGVYGNATQTNYSASKAGIIGFSKALAKEVGRYGIRSNLVAPGFIDTDMTSGLGEQRTKKIMETIPLRRMGTAAEVADAVAYLASPAAAYVTGSVLHIDGGISI
jgi:3-oxoacyl-[acyl-carrier protein] reductase